MKHPGVHLLMGSLCLLTMPIVTASVAADALDRPALMVRAPEHAVVLSAAAAGERWVAVGERGIIVFSDDHGLHWRQAEVPVSTTLTAVAFSDAQYGWAAGHAGVVLRTLDGGEHWSRALDGHRLAQQLRAEAEAAGDPRAISQANALVREGADKPWLALLALDRQQVLVVGAYGLALISTDGGAHWQSWHARLPNPGQLHIYAARRQGARWLLAGEQGLVLYSGDDAQHFERLHPPYSGSFFAAELLPGDGMLLAGLRGHALLSADGGQTWQIRSLPAPVSITATTLDENGQVVAVHQGGDVMRLDVATRMWVKLNPMPLPPLAGLLVRPGTPWLLLGMQGVHVLPEGGQ